MAPALISVEDLRTSLDTCTLIDCREPSEHRICSIPGSQLIPLGRLARRAILELDPDRPAIIYCHHGIRSAAGAAILEALGFTDVRSLDGGIEAWADRVDPTMLRY